jgi:hypothetical protein
VNEPGPVVDLGIRAGQDHNFVRVEIPFEFLNEGENFFQGFSTLQDHQFFFGDMRFFKIGNCLCQCRMEKLWIVFAAFPLH